MGNVNVGQVFSTGNKVVSTLPVGTLLEVVGKGQVRVGIGSLPASSGNQAEPEAVNFEPGDRIFIQSKNRYGTIVRAGMNIEAEVGHELLYVADDSPVVRAVGNDEFEKA